MSNYFHLPDDITFGSGENGGSITFGEARRYKNELDRIDSLKRRMETYYVNGLRGSPNPFISSILTCMGVEVLGQIMLGTKDGETDEKNTIQVYQMLDPLFKQGLSNVFSLAYNARRSDNNPPRNYAKDFPTYAHIVRKGLRNTFTHSYRSLGVVLDDRLTSLVEVDEVHGMVIIEPSRFREEFISVFYSLFDSARSNENPKYKRSLLKYYSLLIK